jgi:transposase InsO family protein
LTTRRPEATVVRTMPASPPEIPLPAAWHDHAKSAVLYAISLAHYALAIARGWCANSRIARVRLAGDNDRLKTEVALLREELRIKDARMAHIPPRQRPHYPPTERMAILELKAARNWSAARTAERFLLTPATIAEWMKRLDEQGEAALVQLHEPVNRFPDFVGAIVRRLKTLCPTMGRRRIADTLARAGLHLSSSTARRMLEKPPAAEPEPQQQQDKALAASSPGRTVTARYPHHAWNLDLTVMPTAAGFWIPMFPGSIMQRWPFAWWVLVVVDHFSRAVVGFEVFRKQPTTEEVCTALDHIVAQAGRFPKYTVSDQGPQFRDAFRAWCASHNVKPRFGAIGKHGSIAVTERFILSMKNEALQRILVPMRIDDMRTEVARYVGWYQEHRPHSSLRGATPGEVRRGERPAIRKPRLEPRARYPVEGTTAAPQTRVRGKPGCKLELVVSHLDGAAHLPVVEIRKAA